MRDSVRDAIREAVEVPRHVKVAAAACAADLMHGPRYARTPTDGDWTGLTDNDVSPIPGDLEGDVVPVYGGPVGDLLRDFIADIPGDLHLDEDDYVHVGEPQAEEIDGETFEPSPSRPIPTRDVIAALFGEVISREFH